jgi:hypothetical protein
MAAIPLCEPTRGSVDLKNGIDGKGTGMTNYDERDDERDWPEDDATHPTDKSTPEPPTPEPEDDAARLPVRHPPRRRTLARRRGSYRPPSELDNE